MSKARKRKYAVRTNCVKVNDVEKFKTLLNCCATSDGKVPTLTTVEDAGETYYGFKTDSCFGGCYVDGFIGVPVDTTSKGFKAENYEADMTTFVSKMQTLLASDDALIIRTVSIDDDYVSATARIITHDDTKLLVLDCAAIDEVAKMINTEQWPLRDPNKDLSNVIIGMCT